MISELFWLVFPSLIIIYTSRPLKSQNFSCKETKTNCYNSHGISGLQLTILRTMNWTKLHAKYQDNVSKCQTRHTL